MVRISRLETIEISGDNPQEVRELVDKYVSQGYYIDEDIFFSELSKKAPYVAYVKLDEFE
jgi:hypothetical protein